MSYTKSDQPADTFPNAGRDSGYVAPVGEDLVGRLTELLSAMETKLLTSNITLKSEIGRQGDIRREQFSELQHLVDRRHDGLARELDKMLASQEELARGLGKMQGQVDTLSSDLQGLRASHEAQNARHEAQIEELGTRLDRKRERLDAIEGQIHELRGPELSPEQRAHYIAVLPKMIAWWIATYPDDLD